jgi:hypothetical protein
MQSIVKVVMKRFLKKDITDYKEYKVRVFKGTKEWFLNDELHREDGPAVEWTNGDKYWFLNGKRHREDGPAVEWGNGGKSWYLNDKLHREDGPAVEYYDGTKFWYLNGKFLLKEEFDKAMSPVKELSVKQISELLGYEVKIIK